MNPNMPIKAIQEQMQKKFHVAVSRDKAFKAKAKAAVSLRGDVKIQYDLLRDYVMELKRCNPDTTIKIDVYGEEDPESPTRLFRRIYVCLGALKMGFRECGKELIGKVQSTRKCYGSVHHPQPLFCLKRICKS
ncbi:hypothetical protein Tco_0350259 [Tanacetum coccineum]